MAKYEGLVANSGNALSLLNPTIIASQAELAAQAALPWQRIIDWRSYNQPGLTATFGQAPGLSMGAIAFTSETTPPDQTVDFDALAANITISSKGVDVNLYLDAILSSAVPPAEMVQDSITKAYIKKIDTDIMALYTAAPAANIVGGAGTPITYATFVSAFTGLALGVAQGPISFVMAQPQLGAVMQETQFSEWQKRGMALLDSNVVLQAGDLGFDVMGVHFFWSNHYTASAGDHGIMFGQKAIKFLEKQPFRIAINDIELYVGARTMKIGGTATYGTGVIRDSGSSTWIANVIS
jgi:hypothetical protein